MERGVNLAGLEGGSEGDGLRLVVMSVGMECMVGGGGGGGEVGGRSFTFSRHVGRDEVHGRVQCEGEGGRVQCEGGGRVQ